MNTSSSSSEEEALDMEKAMRMILETIKDVNFNKEGTSTSVRGVIDRFDVEPDLLVTLKRIEGKIDQLQVMAREQRLLAEKIHAMVIALRDKKKPDVDDVREKLEELRVTTLEQMSLVQGVRHMITELNDKK